jgi:hypothetical protein
MWRGHSRYRGHRAQESWHSPGLASFLILVVSAGLGMIAPLMQRELAS